MPDYVHVVILNPRADEYGPLLDHPNQHAIKNESDYRITRFYMCVDGRVGLQDESFDTLCSGAMRVASRARMSV